MADLIIFGSGALAREAQSIARSTHASSSLILQPLATDEISKSPLDVLAGKDPATTQVFAAIGYAALNFARFDLWAKLRLLGFRCASLVDPGAMVDPTAKILDNVLVAAGVVVGADTVLGTGSIVQANASIQAGSKLGKFIWVGPGAVIGADTTIGSHQVIGSGVVIADGSSIGGHGEISTPGLYQGTLAKGTFVGHGFDRPVRMIERR